MKGTSSTGEKQCVAYIWQGRTDQWKQCVAYIWQGRTDQWKQCVAYIWQGRTDQWKQRVAYIWQGRTDQWKVCCVQHLSWKNRCLAFHLQETNTALPTLARKNGWRSFHPGLHNALPTLGRSMRTCMPWSGPMCAMWLKLEGGEMIRDLRSLLHNTAGQSNNVPLPLYSASTSHYIQLKNGITNISHGGAGFRQTERISPFKNPSIPHPILEVQSPYKTNTSFTIQLICTSLTINYMHNKNI